MTLPVRERVLRALFERLGTLPGVTVYRNREQPVDEVSRPALVMFDGGHEPPAEETGAARYDMPVTIVGYVKAVDQDGIGLAISTLYADTIVTVMTDPRLGELADDIREGALDLDTDVAEGVGFLAGFDLGLTVIYWTVASNPYQPAPQ